MLNWPCILHGALLAGWCVCFLPSHLNPLFLLSPISGLARRFPGSLKLLWMVAHFFRGSLVAALGFKLGVYLEVAVCPFVGHVRPSQRGPRSPAHVLCGFSSSSTHTEGPLPLLCPPAGSEGRHHPLGPHSPRLCCNHSALLSGVDPMWLR